jgi:D-sedoheptulose 7-phosphate isomerase
VHYFDRYRETLAARLAAVSATTREGQDIGAPAGFDRWRALTQGVHAAGRGHFFIGNGASATMASHLALDCAKNAGLRALAFNDSASLTALGNDLGYDQTFAAPLRWHGQAGDLLIAITSSGRSPNILAAIPVARERGMHVITLTGLHADNPARRLGNVNFFVPGHTYGVVECLHQVLLHCWLDDYMGLADWKPA